MTETRPEMQVQQSAVKEPLTAYARNQANVE